jgi:hypothetical protein
MNIDVIMSYIRPELFILVVFLYCIGLFLKKWPKFTQDWQIPFILLAISIVFTITWMAIVNGAGFTATTFLTGIIQAVLIVSVAVFGDQAIKQIAYKRKADGND